MDHYHDLWTRVNISRFHSKTIYRYTLTRQRSFTISAVISDQLSRSTFIVIKLAPACSISTSQLRHGLQSTSCISQANLLLLNYIQQDIFWLYTLLFMPRVHSFVIIGHFTNIIRKIPSGLGPVYEKQVRINSKSKKNTDMENRK